MSTDNTAKTSPAAVSRALRAAGFAPLPSGTPRHREGVRVEVGAKLLGTVRITVDTGLEGRDTRLAYAMSEALVIAGYEVDQEPLKDGSTYLLTRLIVAKRNDRNAS